MMYKVDIEIRKLIDIFNIVFLSKFSLMFLKSAYGYMILKLPFLFFVKVFQTFSLDGISFLFVNERYFKDFLSNFFLFYNKLIYIFFLRLKIRGLGYSIRKVNGSLFSFFFNYTNHFYLHIPKDVLVGSYKKSMMLLSYNWFKIKMMFVHILLLKHLGPYNSSGLSYPKRMLFLSKGSKTL